LGLVRLLFCKSLTLGREKTEFAQNEKNQNGRVLSRTRKKNLCRVHNLWVLGKILERVRPMILRDNMRGGGKPT